MGMDGLAVGLGEHPTFGLDSRRILLRLLPLPPCFEHLDGGGVEVDGPLASRPGRRESGRNSDAQCQPAHDVASGVRLKRRGVADGWVKTH